MEFFNEKTIRKGRRTGTNKIIQPSRSNSADFSLVEMFERFMVFKHSEGLTSTTVNDYYTHFRWLCNFLGRDLTSEEIQVDIFLEYSKYMIHELGVTPVTANVRIRTIRALLRYAYSEGWIDKPIHDKFKPVKTAKNEIDILTPAEIKAIFTQISEEYFGGYRDKVMFYTLLDTMVRISELLSIKREHVDLRNGSIKLAADGTKTKRERIVPISTRTLKILTEYMKETEDFQQDLLFVTYDGHQLASNTVRKKLREYGDKAGIKKKVSPHIWRHSGAVLYIMNGGDPFSLQDILGHSHMNMTKHYVQMAKKDLKKQHNNFSALKTVFR